jgi:hypothetical protein
MNIHNHNLVQENSIIQKKLENDSYDTIFIDSKMVIYRNQNIGPTKQISIKLLYYI